MSETAITLLQNYGCTKRRVDLQRQLMRELRDIQTQADLSGPEYSAVVTAGMRPIYDLFAESADRLCAQLHRAELIIQHTENEQIREILERHYLFEQSFVQIADAMHFSDRHIRRLHQDALKDLSRCTDPADINNTDTIH